MKKKPLILVTNDDGINAPGLRILIKLMHKIGDVFVVAPNKPRSGCSQSITINSIINCRQIKSKILNIKEYECSGTPADCVKIAVNELMTRKPDLCVSGINHGSNSSINVLYSGTMSAAIESGVQGIPSIGFSLLNHSWSADFNPIIPFVEKIVKKSILNKISPQTILNVNFPSSNKINGIKICKQAKTHWNEKFIKRKSPMGERYYWLSGEFVIDDNSEDSDEWALANGYVSIVPTHFDYTNYTLISKLKRWDL
tara:strand:- start:73 stop:837 length:765 start_codon:yes stop_codon:yes gene_type:complete